MTEKSIEDDIREAMAGIQAAETTTEEAPSEIEPAHEEEPEGRARDEHGRFKAAEVTEEAPEPVANDEPPAEESVAPDPYAIPPTYAKKAIKESWATLPGEVRQELHEREKEIHLQFTRFDQERVFGKKAMEVVAPFEGFIKSLGAEPIQAIDYLIKTDYALRTANPEQRKALFIQAAKDYGIDLGNEPLYADPQQPASDPRIETLQQRLDRLENERQAAIREQQNREQQEFNRQIEAFAADPAHPYFQQVWPHMAYMIENGLADDLQEAYRDAVFANRETRALQLAADQAEEARKRSEQAAAKAKAARSASVSVTGAPGSAVPPQITGTSTGTIEDDIRAAIADVQGRI